MIHMPKGVKVLKYLLSHKEKLEKAASSVKLSEECSAIIQRSLPQKEGDLGSFILPCIIVPLAVKNALADLGARINLMPHSLFQRLGISKLKPTKMKEEEEDFNKDLPVSFYPRTEPVESLECKAPKNRLKPSSFEPPKIELKELPKHHKYDFLQENNQLPVVISSASSIVKKTRLLEVLRNHKGAIADIKRIDSSFCTYKILMEDEFKPSVQPQRRVNPIIKEVVKKEVIKLLDAGLIYPIFDSLWVSPVQVIPKKGGMTVVKNEKDELIPQRTMLERLARHEYYCFLDGFLRRMPFGLCNALATFQRCMTAIFHELIEDNIEAPIMIKPDWSLPFEIMCDASDYAVEALLGQRIDKHFKPIHYANKTMNKAQENYTTTEKELLAVIHDKKGDENLAADHLSRLENPNLGKLTKAEIRDLFPKERLMAISDKNNEPWLYLIRRSLEVLRKFHWMILGGRFNQLSHVSSPLLSKPGEY
ncbi:reverse transcriptase domain-containing protein [Tanacetum coccineum]|uniref:Reverse transcriptase domain-containing protein n=1 Tax=Tanacetum coccineum TaxID=301880 RepID=A0ABQ4XF33_9ASTR